MADEEQAPQDNMASTKRLPLALLPENRAESPNIDAKIVNAFIEKLHASGELFVEKRPGLSAPLYTLLDGGANSGEGRGIYLWNISGFTSTTVIGPPPQHRPYVVTTPVADQVLIVVSGTTFYYIKLVGGSPVITALVNAPIAAVVAGGKFKFIPVPVISGAIVKPGLMVVNGAQVFTLSWTQNTRVVQVVQELISVPLFPQGIVPGGAYLDGTFYLMDALGNIWGSNINDVVTWNGLNVIKAQNSPDGGVALAKQLTYVVAFKSWSTEFFYDAGNATGSPLSPVPGALLPYGCTSADTLQELDGALYFVSTNRSGSPQVMKLEDLKAQVVSSPPIERLLEGNDTIHYYSFTFKHGGHRFYVLSLITADITLVLDIDQKFWYEWTDPDGGSWSVIDATMDLTGVRLMQSPVGGKIYVTEGDYKYPNDNGVLFPVDIYTPNFDAKIDKRKYLKMMRFNSDQVTGSKLQIRVSDNDYQSWSNFRSVDLGSKRPILTDCGTFYRRAWHFRHFANTAFRIRSVDLQLDVGAL